jgi:virginiamycin B lyase
MERKMLTRKIMVITGFLAIFIPASAAQTGNISIKEWDVPTSSSFPHDPAVGADGSLWYTGMASNTLGRLDVSTGIIKEFRLRTPDSGPHGLTSDKNGNIWFTANYKAYIGRLNPQTGEFSEYPISDNSARDPHSLAFDGEGILWFTVQNGNFVGRLDPSTGIIRLKPSPTRDSTPYGIAVDSKGVPFYCEFGTNKIGRIDPVTMNINEYLLPKGARPRRLAISRGNIIFYTDYKRGYLGVLDPKSGKVQEWPSPGGSGSKPYGIAVTSDGTVWYAETGEQPNKVVRFHPETKQFEKWDVPSGGGVIRNMVAAPSGDIYIACSGVNKIGIVIVGH